MVRRQRVEKIRRKLHQRPRLKLRENPLTARRRRKQEKKIKTMLNKKNSRILRMLKFIMRFFRGKSRSQRRGEEERR